MGDLRLTDTQFLSNTAVVGGGGAAAIYTATVTGGLFQNNECNLAACTGGALLVENPLTATGTHFIDNTSLWYGGAVWVQLDTDFWTQTVFENNSCSDRGNCAGGGLYTLGTLRLTNTHWLSNTAGVGRRRPGRSRDHDQHGRPVSGQPLWQRPMLWRRDVGSQSRNARCARVSRQ